MTTSRTLALKMVKNPHPKLVSMCVYFIFTFYVFPFCFRLRLIKGWPGIPTLVMWPWW